MEVKFVTEETLGTIALPSNHRTLHFTTNRVIVAKTGSALGASLLFGAIGAGVAAHREKKRREELEKLSPESVLKSDKSNFAIPYSGIVRVEMKKKRFSGSISLLADQKFGKDMKKKRDKATGEDFYGYEKTIDKKSFEDNVNFLRSVLPSKVVMLP